MNPIPEVAQCRICRNELNEMNDPFKAGLCSPECRAEHDQATLEWEQAHQAELRREAAERWNRGAP